MTCMFTSMSVIAADKEKEILPGESKWSGEAELGYLRTSGNTDTESVNAKGKVVNERHKWRHTGTLETVNKSDRDVKTAERYLATFKSDYKIDDRSYFFGILTYEDDRFSGYEYQVSEVLGYGYTVIKRDDLILDLEAGAGARQSKLETGASVNEALFKGAANLEWKLSDTSTFIQNLSVEAGDDITITRSLTALKMQIVGNLAAKLSHSIKHTSDVPAGFDDTDTESAVTLVYSFN